MQTKTASRMQSTKTTSVYQRLALAKSNAYIKRTRVPRQGNKHMSTSPRQQHIVEVRPLRRQNKGNNGTTEPPCKWPCKAQARERNDTLSKNRRRAPLYRTCQQVRHTRRNPREKHPLATHRSGVALYNKCIAHISQEACDNI